MAYTFSDIVSSHSASAKETVTKAGRFFFLKLDGDYNYTRVSQENYEYAKSLMRKWSCLLGYTDKKGVTHNTMSLSR